MKKNKSLIIGVVVVVIIIAVVVWYFYFRTPVGLKVDTGENTTNPDGSVCPTGTTGTYPNCVLTELTPDAVFENAVTAAKVNITNNAQLTNAQKINATTIIDVYVTKNKNVILADSASGKDIVELILSDAEKIYLVNYRVPIALSTASRATGGR